MPRPRAAACRAAGAEAPEQGEHHEREEPRDVQVEPVFDRRAATAIRIAAQAAARPTRSRAAGHAAPAPARARRRASSTASSAAVPAAVQAPDRERRAAVGLVGERALVDRVQRVVARAPGSDASAADSRRSASQRTARERSAPRLRGGSSRRPCGGEQRRERERRELGQAGERREARRGAAGERER